MSATDATVSPAQDAPQEVLTLEQKEEEKLRSKFPNLKQKGPSNLLQKRLHQKGGRQFFDSGDYQMAKAKLRQGPGSLPRPGMAPAAPPAAAAAAAPAAPPAAAAQEPSEPVPDEEEVLEEATGHEHPTPEDVPHLVPGPMQRKASVHGQSKLTTSPTTHEPPTLAALSS